MHIYIDMNTVSLLATTCVYMQETLEPFKTYAYVPMQSSVTHCCAVKCHVF